MELVCNIDGNLLFHFQNAIVLREDRRNPKVFFFQVPEFSDWFVKRQLSTECSTYSNKINLNTVPRVKYFRRWKEAKKLGYRNLGKSCFNMGTAFDFLFENDSLGKSKMGFRISSFCWRTSETNVQLKQLHFEFSTIGLLSVCNWKKHMNVQTVFRTFHFRMKIKHWKKETFWQLHPCF